MHKTIKIIPLLSNALPTPYSLLPAPYSLKPRELYLTELKTAESELDSQPLINLFQMLQMVLGIKTFFYF
ncbi:MAG: hypothetical protein F6K50_00540 [Moorea sp. SIO3I7]|uniref:hypothetical protein n=1 Tax=unclassified Moorena TaxID=2683338 RepID=UPI0013BF7229|nr:MULTISPECIES: hypothetical protein [unclassified Moorena]NEN94095.1 hypothetical protein [Moorena sp. SIO3I7]NEO04526.1 hypothetical protein [Moorena sp. SIO3I8]NEO18765.1 hypothetical protein [Moorena sp. SIO4A5]NEP21380.1 hypothetical protein [Moorena sp. SIO3I6]NEQ58026.1 hypothetical protein [Moorena sp. SIO4A1]